MASFKTFEGAPPTTALSGHGTPPASERAGAPGVEANRRLRVLVVEDDDDSRELFAEVLELAGHSVTTARDGEDALAAVQAGNLDVVVIDVTLPILDGIQVAGRARQALGGSSPSFLAMSGHALDSHDLYGTSDWPFDAYFLKPVDLDVLVGAVASSPRLSSERGR